MDGPILPPDHTALLARRMVEEEQGREPERATGARRVALVAFTVFVVIGAVVSVAIFVASLL
jgi:hypothetical protein